MYTRRLLVSCVSLAFMTSTFAQAADTKAAAKATAPQNTRLFMLVPG